MSPSVKPADEHHMRKPNPCFTLFLLAVILFHSARAQTEVPYFTKKNSFGGTAVADLNSFTPSFGTFTLEVQATAGTAIQLTGLGITHTPAATGVVRFISYNNKIYVYENKKYTTRYNASPQAITTGSNLLQNPSFEQVGTPLATGRWPATYWNALMEDQSTSAWGAVTSTSVREEPNFRSDSLKSIIMHSNLRYLAQQLPSGTLASNTLYQVSYDYWTSTGTGNGGATYQLQLGTSATSGNVQAITGHTTDAADYTQKHFSVLFQTPALPSATLWFSFYRSLSKVDWLDNLKLFQATSLSPGLTGVSSAIYKADSAFAPEDPSVAELGGSSVNLTSFVPPSGNYTLEVTAVGSTAITIPSIGITYTPSGPGTVRFVCQNQVIHIFENGLLTAKDTAVIQYTVQSTNKLNNPGFESVGTALATGRWPATGWDALTATYTTAWGAGASTSVREDAAYRSEGIKSIIMHSNVAYLTLQLSAGTLASNTWYQIAYDYWTSSGTGNGGKAYQIYLGTTSTGNNLQTITGHTTETNTTAKQSFSTLFQTPAIDSATWFTLYRSITGVDWLDNLRLSPVTGLVPGITGVTAASILYDTVAAPTDERYDAYKKLQKAIDYAGKVLSWYSSSPAKTALLQPAVDSAHMAVNNLLLTVTDINTATATLTARTRSVDKQVYAPAWMMGDVTSNENAWSNTRSVQSKDWVLFWEKGFNTEDPDNLYYGTTKCDVNWIFELAENSFHFYADSLKFIRKDSSKTDTYKMVIRLRYTGDWEASGSGVDNLIGLLTLTPWAYNSRGGQTVAHEIGHCFQYQVHCDNNDQNGWMYGFGDNASGSNGWWEQCAQWQAYKVIPSQQFTSEWFGGYLSNAHKHTLHETPRYNNYFIQDYWCDLHDMGIIGRLWNKSYKPEDPIEAYKRLTGINQSQFNEEMYYCGARFASWDVDAIRTNGAGYIAARAQPKLNAADSNYWQIDSTACLENYGHNIIQLNAPAAATTVSVSFKGLAGTSGYRNNYVSQAGWRIGFVALLTNGTRVYGTMDTVVMNINNGLDSLSFNCPANCSRLWLVVSGAPASHWRHAWDNTDANDEQWPYKVRFGNTNIIGQPTLTAASIATVAVSPVTGYNTNDETTLTTAVYPNPVSSILYVKTGSRKGVFVLRNAVGQPVKTIACQGNEIFQLNIASLPAGVYYWNFNNQNGKVLKQ